MSTEKKLGTYPIPKLMLELSIPMIIAQFINVLYNLVDRMYIGRISASALTGLGLCFPIIMIVSAFSSFAGTGGAPLAAIELGKGDKKNAEKILGNAIILIVFFSISLTILFTIFQEPLLRLFGASDATISYAMEYLSVYLLGTVFVQVSLGLNPYITCQGQSRVAMVSVVLGAVTNIILDPIFIFWLDMGVRGAALATILSQALSAIWILKFLTSHNSTLRITRNIIKPDFKIFKKISSLGVSPFIMQSTESLVNITFTSQLALYGGDLYVGSITIVSSIMQLFVIPISGFTNGVQPIISYNYGAKNLDRVRSTIRYMLKITCTVGLLVTSFIIWQPALFASLFTNDVALIEIVKDVLPIYIAGMMIFGVQMTAQSTFVGIGFAKISLFIACLRKLILLIPLIFLFSRLFGLMGIYYAEPVADSISAITAGCFLCFVYNKHLKQDL